MIKFNNGTAADNIWSVYGSFGMACGGVVVDGNKIYTEGDGYRIETVREEKQHGVIVQSGKLTNTGDAPINVTYLASKFIYEGGEYEVYTQSCTWENESVAMWQPLNSTIGAEVYGIRDAYGAEPFFGIWSCQSGRGTAFHILADCAWKYTVTTVHHNAKETRVEAELGINNRNFLAELLPGESLEFPTVIYYEIRNKLDLDCYKLHSYVNNSYPPREMPVMFNTWMYKYEFITVENVCEQIERARELGVEYFVIDAGWFGQGNFWKCRGDWYENTEAGFKGNMAEVSERVRAAGMKFGFWLEIETAGCDSNNLAEHPEYFFKYKDSYFLDFRRKDACDWICDTVCSLLEKYGAECIKFDFNQDLRYDLDGVAFIKYFKGYRDTMARIKARHPELYVENCASGGLRMTLSNSLHSSGMWMSDNHSLYEGMRIYKDTIRRMSPQAIERWASVTSVNNFSHSPSAKPVEKTFASNDALWTDVRGVDISWLTGFLTGSAIGISCSLTAMSDELFNALKKHIADFKAERDFWRRCICHVLCDTPSVLVLQYSDEEYDKIKLVTYSDIIHQSGVTVYPRVCKEAVYRLTDKRELSGREIDLEGVTIPITGCYKSSTTELCRIR